MSLRVQVILEERDALKFRSQALKESKSLSAWFGTLEKNAGNQRSGTFWLIRSH